MDDQAAPAAGGISEAAARAARHLRVVFSRLRRRIREVAQDEGALSPSQESALTLVGKHGAATASALAAAEGVRPQSMATTLAALEQHGMIRRAPDPDDGRRQLVTLTEAGLARTEGNRQAREEWLARAIQDRYTEEERRTILRALDPLERLSQPGYRGSPGAPHARRLRPAAGGHPPGTIPRLPHPRKA